MLGYVDLNIIDVLPTHNMLCKLHLNDLIVHEILIICKHPNKRERRVLYTDLDSLCIVCRSICMFRSLFFCVCLLCKSYYII